MSANPQTQNQRRWWIPYAAGAAGAGVAIAAFPVAVGLLGFGAGGIAAGSTAAGMMSTGVWGVAALQSIGAAGVGSTSVILSGVAGAAAGASPVALYRRWWPVSSNRDPKSRL